MPNQDVQVPSESYDISHDADEMEMSDDEAPAAYGMRYGKRTRSEMVSKKLSKTFSREKNLKITCFFIFKITGK